MARQLFINVDKGTFVNNDTDPTPRSGRSLFAGDYQDVVAYFLRETGVVGAPFRYVDKSAADLILSAGRSIAPLTGGLMYLTYTQTTPGLAYNPTASDWANALNALAAIGGEGGVTVTGSVKTGFRVRWNNVGVRATLIAVEGATLTPSQEIRVERRQVGAVDKHEVQEITFRPVPAVSQHVWNDLSTVLNVAVSTQTEGSAEASEVQTFVFSQRAAAGEIGLTLPSMEIEIDSIVAGLATATENTGLVPGQPIQFSGSTGASNFSDGVIYYVREVISLTKFTFAATPGGAALATATASGSTCGTLAQSTRLLPHSATPAQWQSALEALTSIGAGNVSVEGWPREEFVVAFRGGKGFCNLPEMTVITTLTGAPGKSGIFDLRTIAARDLLAGTAEQQVYLECELAQGGRIETTARAQTYLTEELVRGGGYTPAIVPGTTRAGAVEIDDDTDEVEVVFPSPLAQAPTSILVSVSSPGDFAVAMVDLSTVTAEGFTARLMANTTAPGFFLNYLATQ